MKGGGPELHKPADEGSYRCAEETSRRPCGLSEYGFATGAKARAAWRFRPGPATESPAGRNIERPSFITPRTRMKFARLIQASSLAAAGAFTTLHVSAEEAVTPAVGAPAAETPATPTISDEQVFEAFGYLNGQGIYQRINEMAKQLEMTDAERAQVFKGFAAALAGEEGKFSHETYGAEIQRVLGGRQQAAQAKASEKATAESEAFFAKLKENPAIKSTPSGLHYEVIEAGTDPKPTADDTVKVHYTGTLVDGTKFDSSVDRGEPAEFPLKGVIPGWTEGLQLVGKGGKLKLYIPSKLGYGEQGAGGSIPPNATLIFDVELIDITPAAAPAATEGK